MARTRLIVSHDGATAEPLSAEEEAAWNADVAQRLTAAQQTALGTGLAAAAIASSRATLATLAAKPAPTPLEVVAAIKAIAVILGP